MENWIFLYICTYWWKLYTYLYPQSKQSRKNSHIQNNKHILYTYRCTVHILAYVTCALYILIYLYNTHTYLYIHILHIIYHWNSFIHSLHVFPPYLYVHVYSTSRHGVGKYLLSHHHRYSHMEAAGGAGGNERGESGIFWQLIIVTDFCGKFPNSFPHVFLYIIHCGCYRIHPHLLQWSLHIHTAHRTHTLTYEHCVYLRVRTYGKYGKTFLCLRVYLLHI